MKYTIDIFRIEETLPTRISTDSIDEIIDEVDKKPAHGLAINRLMIHTHTEKAKLIALLEKLTLKFD